MNVGIEWSLAHKPFHWGYDRQRLGERGADFGAVRPAPGVVNPLAGGDAAKLRSAIVQLEMDGALPCDQALPIVAAALEGNVRAVSLSLTGKDASPMRFAFYSAEMPPVAAPTCK